ncbi:hypothetical protein AVEN_239493-1 [Araneus ventricosus]|uniref:Uncharacterized protein n=1 Tax=Araneus ventricosus TaxID=182803 RepID=A0A4Y2ILW6_ARAVE|nr:hypothetical protein AVEN_239493-1 [Araneus ventricosus]
MLVGRLSPRWSSPGLTSFLGPIHDGSSKESGFEHVTLRLRGRHLATKPTRLLRFIEGSEAKFRSRCGESAMNVECGENEMNVECGESAMNAECGESAMNAKCGESAMSEECEESTMNAKCGESAMNAECGESARNVECGENAMNRKPSYTRHRM